MDPANARTVRTPALLFGVLLALLAAPIALGQTTPAAAPKGTATPIPRPDELEPGVDTTKGAPSAPAAPSASAPGRASSASAVPPPAQPGPAASAATRTATGTHGAAPPKGAAADGGGRGGAGRKGTDRLELETTDVTGNSELPKVLYIVPWKRSDLGDMVGRPVNSLLDEVLQPVDRDVFKRENRYYDALKPEASAANPDAAQDSGLKP